MFKKRSKVTQRSKPIHKVHLSTTFDVDINKLFFFYTKCYRNDPLRFLMSIFRKDYTTLSRWFNDVLDALTADDSLVSQHLNDSWTRSKVDQHTPDYIKDLYDRDANRLIFMTDGTLIQIQKPQHFNRQKKSWADRKSINSLNFMPIMALDGSYIINIGPFYGGGDNSDEFVFKAAINSEYREWCRNNQGHDDCMFDIPMLDQLDDFFENTFDEDVDNMIGDRGYGQPGDRSKALECPDNLNPKKKRGVPSGPARKQLPTNEANRTRKVTYIRHTAERKYSQSKTFRIVGTIVLQQFCRRIKDILDVLFATMNRCLPALISHSEKRRRFAQRILDHQQYKKSEVGHYISQTFAIRNLKVCFFDGNEDGYALKKSGGCIWILFMCSLTRSMSADCVQRVHGPVQLSEMKMRCKSMGMSSMNVWDRWTVREPICATT